MGQHADRVKRLTFDPGVAYLAQIADDHEAQLTKLRADVDACCTKTLTDAKDAAAAKPRIGASTPTENASVPQPNPDKL